MVSRMPGQFGADDDRPRPAGAENIEIARIGEDADVARLGGIERRDVVDQDRIVPGIERLRRYPFDLLASSTRMVTRS
jgi:hypothetical protein